MLKVAVLDDYLHQSQALADWSVLRGRCALTVFDRPLGGPEETAQALAPFHVLCHLRERTPMPRALMERLPALACQLVTGKAHRTLDLAAATELGIVVSHVSPPESASQATPELAWGLILATARHIAYEDRQVRAGAWQRTTGMLLEGKTLGLLGLGRIGQRMAHIGRAFGMRVIAWSQNLAPELAAAHGVLAVDKDTLFAQSDVLSVHLVLSARTHHLVGPAELAQMKPTALLINTARGAIVDEPALVQALAEGRLAGAGLDVFEAEPLPIDSPLRQLDQVVLTPHLGYATTDTFTRFYQHTVQGLVAYLDGAPLGVANPDVLTRVQFRRPVSNP